MDKRAETSRENGKKGGRPVGSFTKPQISDYVTQAQVDKLMALVVSKAQKGDTIMLRFVAEQLFGRAKQSVNYSQTEMPIPILGGTARAIDDDTPVKLEQDWLLC